MSDIFIALLNMSIAASWVIIAVIVVRLLIKKAPKWLSCLLWAIVAVRLVCPFTFESMLSLIPSSATVSPDIMYSTTPAIDSGITVINNAVNPIITHTFTPDAAMSANPLQIWGDVAAYIWLAGVFAMLIYAAVSYIVLRRRIEISIPADDNVRICDSIDTPFILGIVRPQIYLPSDMDGEYTDYVRAHETAHLKRLDHIWKPLGFVLLAVYWFNPLCWLAYVLLCRDIELACDENVIRDLDMSGKKAYSEALLSCGMPRKLISACPLAFGEIGVKVRIKSVLNYKKPAFWIIIVSVIGCIVLAVCFLTNPKSDALPEGHWFQEGLYLRCDNGADMIIVDNYGPISMTPDNDSISFDGLTDGDKIRAEVYTIEEIYPAQTIIYGIEKLSDGEYSDINADMIASLTEMGWLNAINTADFQNTLVPLTLDDVLTLSKKRESLIWSDFDGYSYTETGSGLYIRVYEIDEIFSVWIGGGSTDEKPMYIYLTSGRQGEPRIDIRTDDVAAFIEENKTSVISITSIDDWDTFENSEDADPSLQYFARQYLSDILNGKIAELSGVIFGDYKIIKEYTNRDDYYEYLIRFDVEILSSDIETLPVGKGSYYVFGDGPYGAYLCASEELAINSVLTLAQYAIYNYLQFSDNNLVYPVGSDTVAQYIIRLCENDGCTPEQMQDYAKRIFDIDGFTPDEDDCDLRDGKYVVIGRGGNIWSYRFISETEYDGTTTVTVRFYSDYAKYAAAQTVEYKLGVDGDVYTFVSSEIIESSGGEPYHVIG